jgi:sigma-B regulation protein RsbU (phosphoserine phosphatase)
MQMERQLRLKNDLLSVTLEKLQHVYDSLDRDLIEARKLQQSLIRERQRRFGGAQVSLILRPSGHVGGDLVGFFPISDTRVGVFSFDVSGHGVTSALMTARLAGLLSGASPSQNIALLRTETGYDGRRPDLVARRMNRLLMSEMDTEHYLTLGYADTDLTTGRVAMVQAGHPHPLVQRRSGEISFLGDGGLPIGLIPAAQYETFDTHLAPGDRLLMMSDGVTECCNPEGVELGENGLEAIVRKLAGLRGNAFLEALIWEVSDWAGRDDFTDDVSGALLEFDSYSTP